MHEQRCLQLRDGIVAELSRELGIKSQSPVLRYRCENQCMSDPHDWPFIYLLVSGAIVLIVAIAYGTYLQIRDNARKRERREQRRADKKKGKRPSR